MQPYGMIVALHAGSETEQTALCMEARTHDIRQRSLPNIGRSKKKKKKKNQAIGKSQVKRSKMLGAWICWSKHYQAIRLL